MRQAEAAGAAARRQVRNQARQISDKLVVVMDHLLSLRDEEGFSDALGDAVAATLTTLASRVGAEQENLALMKPAVEEASEALRRAATAYDSLPSESLTMGQLKMAEVLSSDPGFDRAEQLEKWRADAKAEREEAARIALEKFNNEMREAAGQLPQPPAPPSSDEPGTSGPPSVDPLGAPSATPTGVSLHLRSLRSLRSATDLVQPLGC